MQHSGSVNHYTDKLIFRYDGVGPEWIDRAIELFRERGRPVYVLLDDWELPIFAEKFSGRRAAAIVSSAPLAISADRRVKLFATDSAEVAAVPRWMQRTEGCLASARD
jgi:hypothetical protein